MYGLNLPSCVTWILPSRHGVQEDFLFIVQFEVVRHHCAVVGDRQVLLPERMHAVVAGGTRQVDRGAGFGRDKDIQLVVVLTGEKGHGTGAVHRGVRCFFKGTGELFSLARAALQVDAVDRATRVGVLRDEKEAVSSEGQALGDEAVDLWWQ